MQSGLDLATQAVSVGGYDAPEPDLDELNQPVLLCLLGQIRLITNGRQVSLRSGGKMEALLVQLGLAPRHGVRREALLNAIWPESDPSLAGHALNTLVHRLRDMVAAALRDAPPVLQSAGYYRLNHEAGVCVDVARFKSLVARGDQLGMAGQATAAAQLYQRAVALYQGDLTMPHEARAQSILERATLHATYLECLMRLSDSFFARGDVTNCASHALQLLANDPCREDAHRLVMRCYVRRGERAQALRHYRVVQEILRQEFDAEPESATTALFNAVRLEPGAV
jgi:DNA-binding SARP family transcriptional activator